MTDEIQKDKTNSQGLMFVDRIMDTVDIVVGQVTSGRWLLTVGAGICLIHFAWTPENHDKVIDIIKDIVIFYFVVRDASKTTTTVTTPGDTSVQVSKSNGGLPDVQSSVAVVQPTVSQPTVPQV